MEKIKSYNPSNNELLGEVKSTSLTEIQEIITNSKLAFEQWGYLTREERKNCIKELYQHFKMKKEELATLITKEMGMPIVESLTDIDNGLENIKWYIENLEEAIGGKITYEDEQEVDKIIFEPKGVVAVILAWNFPFSSFVWQAIPNLIVGNTVIVKHSEYVPLCSKFIYDIVSNILPKNVYNAVYGDGEVGENLAKQEMDMICFTGSTKTGQKLYKIASEKFIPVLLECGGSAPGIILEDAAIDVVLDAIYINKFTNAGQICDGEKRLLVQVEKQEEVIEKLKLLIENKKVGDPLDKNTEIGPLVSLIQLEKIEEQVEDAVKKGAKIICGGKRLEQNHGNYYLPTLITNITKEMRIYKEEVFGPVLPILTFKTIEEAIEMANDTDYGLGAYVYTKNKTNYEQIVKQLKTGMIALNNLYYLRPCNPFGGYKKSGLGKNNSLFGLQELCNIKVVTYEKDNRIGK